MSNEAAVRTSLQIRKTSTSGAVIFQYQSQPGGFNANVNGTNGPTPGAVTVPTAGVAILLTQLTSMGGLCRIMNLDPTNTVHVGIREISSNKFFPLLMLLPTESYVLRLSDHLLKEEVGTGTFTGATTQLFAKAFGAACVCLFEVFDP